MSYINNVGDGAYINKMRKKMSLLKTKNAGFNLNTKNKTFGISVRSLERNPHWVLDTANQTYTNTQPNTGNKNIQTGWVFSKPMSPSEANKLADKLAEQFLKMGYTQVKHDEVA